MSCFELWSAISIQLVLSCLCGHELQLDITPAFCTKSLPTSGRATFTVVGQQGVKGDPGPEGPQGLKGGRGARRERGEGSEES